MDKLDRVIQPLYTHNYNCLETIIRDRADDRLDGSLSQMLLNQMILNHVLFNIISLIKTMGNHSDGGNSNLISSSMAPTFVSLSLMMEQLLH